MTVKRVILIQLILAILLGFFSIALAAPEWQVTIWVTEGSGKTKLELGADSTATDGLDKAWDSYTMLGGSLRAYYPRPDWHPTFQNYWRDIRAKAPGKKSEWTLVVESDTPNSNVYLTWDLSMIPADYGVTLNLDDAAGQSIDMRSTPFFGFPYSSPRNLRVSVEAPAEPPPPSNQPPVANAGADQIIELESCDGATVALDGTASTDPDGDPLGFVWTWDGGRAEGPSPTVTLPMGTTVVTLTVTDPSGSSSTDSIKISVNDTIAASLDVEVTPNVLWPPNGHLVRVMPAVAVKDTCHQKTKVNLLSVTSNEPESGLETSDAARDIVQRDADGSILLRAERSPQGGGRVYTLTYVATDAAGNQTTGSARVTVPKNKPKDR